MKFTTLMCAIRLILRLDLVFALGKRPWVKTNSQKCMAFFIDLYRNHSKRGLMFFINVVTNIQNTVDMLIN